MREGSDLVSPYEQDIELVVSIFAVACNGNKTLADQSTGDGSTVRLSLPKLKTFDLYENGHGLRQDCASAG